MLAEGYQTLPLASTRRRSLLFFFLPVVHLLCHDPYDVTCLFHAVHRGSGADPHLLRRCPSWSRSLVTNQGQTPHR